MADQEQKNVQAERDAIKVSSKLTRISSKNVSIVGIP